MKPKYKDDKPHIEAIYKRLVKFFGVDDFYPSKMHDAAEMIAEMSAAQITELANAAQRRQAQPQVKIVCQRCATYVQTSQADYLAEIRRLRKEWNWRIPPKHKRKFEGKSLGGKLMVDGPLCNDCVDDLREIDWAVNS